MFTLRCCPPLWCGIMPLQCIVLSFVSRLQTQSKDALRSHRRAPLERRGGGAAGRRDVRNTSSIFRGVTKHRWVSCTFVESMHMRISFTIADLLHV